VTLLVKTLLAMIPESVKTLLAKILMTRVDEKILEGVKTLAKIHM
jgi:hypothetical protein